MRYWLLLLCIFPALAWAVENEIVDQGRPLADDGFTAPPGWSFVEIKPGSFTMGSPASEEGRNENEVQHKVTLTHGFWLGKYEVTQEQYVELMGTNPSRHCPGRNLPVETVSWDDAQEFLQRLTDREQAAGRLPADWVYRLPTEAEWEYAARAGTTTAYFFGDDAGELGEYAWYGEIRGQTHEVGLKDPNPWGLYDMYGNVYEWCADWYGAYPIGDATDPTGPDDGSHGVLRGGSWLSDPQYCRSAYRCILAPGDRGLNFGFRVLAIQTVSSKAAL